MNWLGEDETKRELHFLQNKRSGILECFPCRCREKDVRRIFFLREGVSWVELCPQEDV